MRKVPLTQSHPSPNSKFASSYVIVIACYAMVAVYDLTHVSEKAGPHSPTCSPEPEISARQGSSYRPGARPPIAAVISTAALRSDSMTASRPFRGSVYCRKGTVSAPIARPRSSNMGKLMLTTPLTR